MAGIDYQRTILSDRVRNEAFAKALKKIVKPGCTVVDIGAGTGFLSFLAREYGAGYCILIEREEEFSVLSREIAKDNGISGCTFMHAHSRDVRGIPKADVVISETLGNFATEENILETLTDARRFLKPRGTMLPQRISQFASPVVTDRLWKEIAGTWDTVGYGLDWEAGKRRSLNNMYVKRIAASELLQGLDTVREWDAIDLKSGKAESIRTATIHWRLPETATVFGFCLSWECTLLPGISISTSPLSPETHWQQIYLPVEEPLALNRDDTLELSLRSDTRWKVKIHVAWKVVQRNASGNVLEQQEMDMERGY